MGGPPVLGYGAAGAVFEYGAARAVFAWCSQGCPRKSSAWPHSLVRGRWGRFVLPGAPLAWKIRRKRLDFSGLGTLKVLGISCCPIFGDKRGNGRRFKLSAPPKVFFMMKKWKISADHSFERVSYSKTVSEEGAGYEEFIQFRRTGKRAGADAGFAGKL